MEIGFLKTFCFQALQEINAGLPPILRIPNSSRNYLEGNPVSVDAFTVLFLVLTDSPVDLLWWNAAQREPCWEFAAVIRARESISRGFVSQSSSTFPEVQLTTVTVTDL